jgi:peptidoglycan hydrolase-like protein with peptidoglycan-binding domain|tara:strand:+ start:3807 stop:4688 length:882 start_codon:yes stop_codon:yes gene_type:complete
VRIGCAVVFGLVALGGCSTALTSGDGRATVIATTVAPTTTAAPTTTVAPNATEAPTTTVTPTTTAPTTTLPVNIVEVLVLDPPIPALGTSDGAETARLQNRLTELGFWVQGIDGDYGRTTRQAVMAFEKYMGFDSPDGKLDEQTATAISNIDLRPVARANSGTLVEVDKAKQLLFFVVEGRTEYILNTSTGNGEAYEEPDQNTPGEIQRGISLTPSGLHDVNRERPDGWWEGDLGEIYRPKYFVGGVAVHGSNSIPNYPASHGCVRVSVPAMDWIWESGIMPLNSPVWVHDGA